MTLHYFSTPLPMSKSKSANSVLLNRSRDWIESEFYVKIGLPAELLEVLADRDLYILYRCFGFIYEEKTTLESIGNEFGISRQRIHVIKNRSIARLQLRAQELGIDLENLSL